MEQGKEALKNFLHAITRLSESKKRETYESNNHKYILNHNSLVVLIK